MKTLETLICAGMTALALACGDGNGSSSSSGSAVPGCTSHNDCRGERMCVEGECKDYEQACPIDYTFRCDEDSKFKGIYSVEKSTCAMNFGEEVFSSFGFKTNYNCSEFGVLGIQAPSSLYCMYSEQNAHETISGNYVTVTGDLFVPDNYVPLEFRKCNAGTIYFQWKDRECSALLKKEQNEFEDNYQLNSCNMM